PDQRGCKELKPMKCANHPTFDSVAYCGLCGRPLCPECEREVHGMVYCETCLANRVQTPFGPQTGPSPGVALALGFIPGVGSIYNGQVVKAMIQVLIFGSLIALSDRVGGPMKMNAPIGAALLIGLGVLFLPDNLGIPVFRHIGRYWPVLLIVVGVILLRRRLGGGPPSPPSTDARSIARGGPGGTSGPREL